MPVDTKPSSFKIISVKKKYPKRIAGFCIFASTVPVLHTIRTAGGSFFYIPMANKPAYTIANQFQALKSRRLLFRDETLASHLLKKVSYFRLKGIGGICRPPEYTLTDQDLFFYMLKLKPGTFFSTFALPIKQDYDESHRHKYDTH